MRNRRRKLQKTKEPEEEKENLESKTDDSKSAIINNVVDKRRKLEDNPDESNAQSRDEDAVTIDRNIEFLVEMEAKVERENDVQSIEKVFLPIQSVGGKDKPREEGIEDLANQDGILPTKKCGKQNLKNSLKQEIDQRNDVPTDDVDDHDVNDNNNCSYIYHNNQDVHTIRSPSSGDGPSCKFVANNFNQVKKPRDLAAKCQNNTYVSAELDLHGKNHTEITCVSPSIGREKLINHSKVGDKIINMSCEVSEKLTDLFHQTDKVHQNDSCENHNRAIENNFKINKQSAVNASLTSDLSFSVNTTEIHMVQEEIYSCPNMKSEAENLSPDKTENSNKEEGPNWGPSSSQHLDDCSFDKGEVSEPELKQKVNNLGVASVDIPKEDTIHPDNRQDKDITDSQLCDVDWMSQFPEEISLGEPVQVCQDADQSGTASSKYVPIEDGSAIMAGFIKELSQLNKMLLRTKREMENARRQKKTSSNM